MKIGGKERIRNNHRFELFILLFVVLSACTSPTSAPTERHIPQPTTTSPQADVPSLISLPNGDLIYGDPEGRFTIPLPTVGEWNPAENEGAYARFTIDDPPLEMYVVTTESADLKAAMEAALQEIGVDTSALSLLGRDSYLPWLLSVYSFEDGGAIGGYTRRVDNVTVAIIAAGEMSDLTSVEASFVATIDGFATVPLTDYLNLPPPVPSTVEDIKDLNAVQFYNDRTKLVGRLSLPEGEGPFPAIVYTGAGSGLRTRDDFAPYFLQDAGFAVFTYDKRGVSDSEGVFVHVGIETGEWRLPQLAEDALAAVAFLQGLDEINPGQIGLMGASQNGWTIPLAASQSDAVAFTVIFSGPSVSLGEELYWSKITNDLDTISDSEREALSQKLTEYDEPRGFDPRPFLETMTIPGLWILGDRDGSMPARESKAILESIIEEYEKDFSIIYLPNAGHAISENRSDVVEWIYDQIEE